VKRKKGDLTPLKDILAGMLKDPTLPFNPADADIWTFWEESVGPAIAKNARPAWLKDKRLRVTVTDPIWLQELQFEKIRIIERLNHKLGREAVEKIDFRIYSG
jgi:predicted nucleic acid-binding Zn ribbon protein